MKPWFRFYHEALDDPKVQRLPAPLFRSWVNLLCLASRYEGDLPCLEDCAFSLRMSVEEMHETLTLLCEHGLIDADGPEELRPHNWDARQPASDGDSTGAARQARYRANRGGPNPTVTAPDVDSVTGRDSNALRDPLRNGEGDALRNPARPDVDQTETRQDQTQSALRAPRMRAREAAQPDAPQKAPVTKPAPKPPKAEQPSDAAFELLDLVLDETHAELRGEARRREAIQADALLRRTGGDIPEAVAYVRHRLEHGQSPALQWAARDYAPGWINRTNGARASPTSTGKSTLGEMLALDARESEEERIRGARRVGDQTMAARAAVL